ncbi:protein NEN1-like [Aristolochia californica]|uniref:protein NEN1-like n=1 Tax=Aristolochia californica TaxID=171875 RepID=UPI0035DB727E
MESSSDVSSSRQELVFMDVETTMPFGTGQKCLLLEFGAILVCPRRLLELDDYSTLIRPSDLSSISPAFDRGNGITKDALAQAPYFAQVADKVFDILHGRVWVGHNILKFDCPRIREAFADIGRPAPEPSGTLDSLPLLTQRFGRRAGNMKMATLARYFELGEQKHRSLDDVRMNLKVLKHCAAVLFLDSCLANTSTTFNSVSQNPIFLDPDEVSLHSITTSISPVSHGRAPRILLMHDDIPLQICCIGMRICFGVNFKFQDDAGRPRINIVVDPSPSLIKVLDMCDDLVWSSFMNLGSTSEWNSVVRKNDGYNKMSTIQLHIPIARPPSTMIYSTEIHQRDTSARLAIQPELNQASSLNSFQSGGSKHTWRAQYNGELYAAFGKDESLPKKNLLILSGS